MKWNVVQKTSRNPHATDCLWKWCRNEISKQLPNVPIYNNNVLWDVRTDGIEDLYELFVVTLKDMHIINPKIDFSLGDHAKKQLVSNKNDEMQYQELEMLLTSLLIDDLNIIPEKYLDFADYYWDLEIQVLTFDNKIDITKEAHRTLINDIENLINEISKHVESFIYKSITFSNENVVFIVGNNFLSDYEMLQNISYREYLKYVQLCSQVTRVIHLADTLKKELI